MPFALQFMKNEEAISARIKEIYARSGCATVSKWAQKVFVPQTTLNDIISKEKMPSLATLANICEYEGVSMDWVIFGQDNKKNGNIAIASGDNSQAANGNINSHTTYGTTLLLTQADLTKKAIRQWSCKR